MKCRFDKSKNFIRAYALYLKTKGNKDVYEPTEEFLKLLVETFDNPEVAAKAVEDYVGAKNPAPTGSLTPVKNVDLTGNYRRSEDSDNIASYYVGDSGYRRMISKFRKDVLGASILSIDLNTGAFKFFDSNEIVNPNLNITRLQSNILLYKQRLLNNLLKVVDPTGSEISLSESIDDLSFTKTVDDVLAMFEAKLNDDNRSVIEANGYYDDYVILKNFDRLVDRYTSYITIDNSYRKNKWEGVRKYSLTPKVKHYSGFSKDEGADISKQISDLAETILKIIPEIDANGNIVKDSVIGVDGFNGSMMTLKRALLYSQNLGEKSVEYRKLYSKGAGSLEEHFQEIVQDFINNNTSKPGETSTYSEFRQLYIHNKLRGISKFLMSKDTPSDIKNMFLQMFVKTEPATYRAYSYDQDTEMFMGKDLKSRMIVTQKRAIQNVISSGIRFIQSGSRKIASDLAKKYSIKISENNGVETVEIVNNNTNQKVVLSYMFDDKTSKLKNLTIDEGGDTIFEDLLRDVYAYTVPDTYASCISEVDYDWKSDFAPFIVLAAKEIKTKLGDIARGRSLNIHAGDEIDLKSFNSDLLNIGRRLGVIYGDSIHNTIRNLSGNNLPLFQLTSLEYNWRMCLDDAKEIKYDNPMEFSIFWDNEDLLTEPQRRSEVSFNEKIKSPAKLNLEELMKLSIIDDFLFPYLGGDTIYFQNTTFSDKTTHFLPGFKLNTALKGDTVTEIFGSDKTLHNIIDDALKNGTSKITEWSRKVQMQQAGTLIDNVLNDYAAVFGWTDILPELADGDQYYKNVLKCAKILDERLKSYDIQTLRNAFAAKHIIFREEIHATIPKAKGLGKCRFNETMLNIFESSTDSNSWNQRVEREKIIFKNDIKRTKLYGFTKGMERQIERIMTIDTIKNDKFYNPITKEYSFVSEDGTLNPIAEVYFALDQILSNQFNILTTGNFWTHTNKNKEGVGSDYLTYSEANRFVNQIKRNVIFGSTIHPFAQGIKSDAGYEIGVTPEINIAIIEDQDGLFYTPAGIDTKGDAQDGCGWSTALQSILENNSLVDAKVGDNKKTIVHDIDHRYGAPTLLKWAVYSLTNSVRRNGKQSIANVEDLVYRMYNVRFNSPLDADLNQDYQNFKSKNGPIYIYDLTNCVYKEITGIQKNADGTYQTIYADGTTSKPITVNTLYDIDQLFGRAWTFDKNPDGTFSGNEASSYILAEIACKYNLRDKQIAYAVNASGCKVGAANINTKEMWTSRSPLRSYRISTKYAGAMMDADHELDMAEVTEMSQMISALIEDGFYTDIVTNIYKEIGEIALNNEKTQKYIRAVDEGNRAKIAELLGKSLIASFQTGNKDTIGLAQAFIRKFDTEYKKAKLAGTSVDYTIPFSDPTIFGAFVADITSRFNKDAIRRKYEGFAGIMNPSYNMMQYYRNTNGEVKLFQQFNEECREKLEPIVGTLPDEFTDWVELAKLNVLSNGELNPMLVQISRNDIDFEDTIVLQAPDGTITEEYINTQEKYDLYKHLLNLDGYIIYNHTARPKNLRGVDTKLTVKALNEFGQTVDVGTFSYYSIDSVRAALYIQKGIRSDDPFASVKQALITKVCGTITDPAEQLAYCNRLTQNFLKKLDQGKEYVSALNRGEIVDLSDVNLGHQECFGIETTPLIYYASDYVVRPAEIIIGRYQFDKLGLTDQDHIWQIKDSGYFYNKLVNQFVQPILNIDPKVGIKAYDRVLYHKGKPFLVKVGNITHGNDGLKETKCVENNVVGDDLRWESEVILTNETDNEDYFDKFKFTYLEDSDGHKYPTITVQSWDDLEELTDSDFFEDFYRKNAYGKKSIEIQLEEQEKLAQLAETKFEAFKEGLKFVGARIPTQAMQSFIPADVIAVTDSKLNATYFPVSGMLIEGADLDGDKIFLLTCTLLNNGTVRSGSALQKMLGYKTTSRLLKGKGTTFIEGENGYPINGVELAQFLVPTEKWSDATKDAFVYHANKLIEGSLTNGYTDITFIKPEGIDEELFSKQKKRFLDLLNKHSNTKSYIKDSIETLKSRVFSGIRRVTLGAQAQMKSQITVDSCTEEFKQAARDTEGGKTEQTISPYIPSSKYQMQVQGILGKAVVGIGAVSLKTYFILCTAYNRKVLDIVKDLKDGRYNSAEEILKSIIITNPFTGELTTLSGTNLNKILEIEDKITEWPGKEIFFNTVRTLKTNSSKLEPAESLSSIVSLSADNMKDLALPKLNATEDLVDIYTTAFMIGIPFSEISKIMTSPIFTMLTEFGKDNIFDSYTEGTKVKDLISDFLSDTSVAEKLGNIASRYNSFTNDILPDKWYFNNNLIDKIIHSFVSKDGLIDKTPDYVHYDETADELDQNGNPIVVQKSVKSDIYNLYRYLLFLKERNNFINGSVTNLTDIQKLKNLLPYVEEMSTLGRQASINQGLKTNITDFYNFAHNLEIFINRRIPKRFKNNLHFSIDEFLRDENYRRMWIEYGKDERLGISKGFNILEALTLSPNFFNMSKLVPTVTSLLEASQTYKIATQVADYFRETERKRFSENDFAETVRYIQDLRIFNFLKNCDFELDLDKIAAITGKDIELYLTHGSLDRSSVTKLKLNTGLNLASFKLIMETNILPYLKSKYNDNSFIRDLLIQENDKTGVKGIALPIPMMNIDRDESLSARYTKYLRDFNAISNTSIVGIKIGDLFFLYNLIVNKNQFGQQSFTRIFEDLINNQDVPKYINSYYEYSSSTEGNDKIDGFSTGDLAYRLAKYSKGTKIETSRSIIKNLPPDLTLDLPFLFGEYNLFDTQQNKYRWSKLQNLDPGDVIETLVNALNKTGQKIEVITDENVKEKNLPKERGFIKDGIIYINKSSFKDASSLLGVSIHELSHAVLAAIKTSDKETKQRYYNLLDFLKDDPKFETIAAMYPDRVGSDLLEEVFCNKLEKLLMNKISQDSNIELAIVNDGLLLKGLKTLFKYDDMKIEEGLSTPITNLLEFASEMFNFDNPISSDYTTASQKLAELKTRLFNSKEDKFKLDQVCE